ncbi:hypothetical protein KDM87_14975 [Undibacterium sp. FT147W]|uniref:Uncharacterized protein n=1 Tax=Undibacterium rivi TaxID=2828729 RepID=A0ABS5H5J9_9BURK|nr:hypothetical protein [Undibacterium rivi]MBR7793895.1 hypothetical protein [Undibacterium rivi]
MPLTPEQAAVIAASANGRDEMEDLDESTLASLQHAHEDAMRDIKQMLTIAAGASGMISTAALPALMLQIQARLVNLASARNGLLVHGIDEAARIGVQPFQATVSAPQLDNIRSQAVKYVQQFVGTDKLKLSDRIWRLDRHAQEIVDQAVRGAVLRGDGASQAARDFLARGINPPSEIDLAKDASTAKQISGTVAETLMTGKGSPLDNAARVMRTEINRAHTKAYQQSAAADTASVGTRFMLSPRHPRVDICDMHARANLYGLGRGVYPHGKSPLPAHPNTLSFEVIVYKDEVSAEDKAGKQSVMEFLETVPSKDRKGILGANKNEAFEAGKLRPTMVRSTWGNVKKRIDWSPDSRDKISRDHFNQRVQFPDGVPAITLKGQELSGTDIAKLTGAPDGSVIRINPYAEAGMGLEVKSRFYDIPSQRSFYKSDRGGIVMTNDILVLNKERAPQGMGLRIFATQANKAKDLGLESIEIFAARSGRMNGYYTWPAYGANAKIPDHLKSLLPTELENAVDLLDLMDNDVGRKWWRKHGDSIECHFDLSEGSKSWQQLNKKLTEKRVRITS